MNLLYFRQLLLLFFLIIFSANNIKSQDVQILRKSGYIPLVLDKDFAFLEPTTDTTHLQFVATVKVNGNKRKWTIESLFNYIKETSYNLGANCFRLNQYSFNDDNNITLILDTYYGNDSILNLNFLSHEKNSIFIFSDFNKLNKTYVFKIDGIKKIIKSGTFYKYQNQIGHEVKINIGGFTGSTIWIIGKVNKPATFITLSGFELGGGGYTPPKAGSIGVSFNTGRINYIEGNLGHLLALLSNNVID